MINGAGLNILDFGADPTGVADSTSAIQNAINQAQSLQSRPTIFIPAGIYKTTNTLRISADCVSIVGLGSPNSGGGSEYTVNGTLVGDVTRGPVIRYNGTGVAFTIGKNPFVDGAFINNTYIENLRIEVDQNTNVALRIWHSLNGIFRKISIFGNTGGSNVGVQIYAGVNNLFDYIFVKGTGQQYNSPAFTKLGTGIQASLGYLNDIGTTTEFLNCYITQCQIGVRAAYLYNFQDCIFESNLTGITVNVDATVYFDRCWWEANETFDVTAEDTTTIYIQNSRINPYARQQYFSASSGVKKWGISNTFFESSNAAPRLLGTGVGSNIFTTSVSYPLSIELFDNKYPVNFTIGTIYNNPTVNAINVTNMPKTTYRYGALSLAASTSSNMLTDVGDTAYKAQESGHIISLRVYATNTISAGSCAFLLKKNGSTVAAFSTSISSTTQSSFIRIVPFDENIAAGDVLTVAVTTDGTFTTSNVVAEVVVAFGPSGEVSP
jgi:hypothetical protein